MIELVTKSATLAKSSNSKRVTAQHLKRVIEADEQYDFLNEIVSRVAEGPDAGGKRVKSEDGSDDDMDGEKAGGGRATKRAKGRRKKGE
jgi:Dr1-associated corepressor